MRSSFRVPLPRITNFIVLFAATSAAAVAQTTIYSDTFSRTGQLSGSAPDVRPGSEVWTASRFASNFLTNGSIAYSNIASYPTAYLPLTPVNGVTYSASVTVNWATASSDNWVGLGFGDIANGELVYWGNPWMLLQLQGGAQFWASATSQSATVASQPAGTYPGGSATLRVDYTRSAAGTAVASYYINGTLVSTYNYNTAPTVTSVGLESYYVGANMTFDNFTLTAVPEPSTYTALAGLAVLGVAAFRRRYQRLR